MVDQKNKALKTHKAFLRKFIRDERFRPEKKLLAELLLAHAEGIFPAELLESLIREQFGTPDRAKIHPDDGDIEGILERKAGDDLKQQWRAVIGGQDAQHSNTSSPK
jgi:hypothetical protein